MIDEKSIRSHLEGRLRALSARGARIERDLRARRNPDSEERVTESENDEVLQELGDAERAELARVQHALARLDAGTYETCEGCGEEIPPERLAAVPDTPLCVACAA
jgi:RNA polymerase-binding transcription factor DksA